MIQNTMLRLTNTLTRKKEEFIPLVKNQVGMYSCGMTVYDHTHLGHARKYTTDDILRRTLEYLGYSVKHVMNVTDVGHLTSNADEGEDKLEKGARREGISAWEVAKRYEQEFLSVIRKLNILSPTILCRATEHIKEQIELVKTLEQKGYTYQISDGIYFDTSKFGRYADFAQLKLNDLQEGARVEINREKRNPSDFALWKFSPKDHKRDMEWDSPWGVGFPGWHIECSAMSMKYLGSTFDIHTGGIDLIPVHHTNEIAQSECATGKQFVRYWFHSEFLLIESTKMSKSLGNFYTLDDVTKKNFSSLALRYFILQAHYRSKLNFTWEALQGAQNALNKLYDAVREYGVSRVGCAEFEQRFREALEDDLNTPQALAVMWEVVKSDYPGSAKKATLLKMDRVLGLKLDQVKRKELIIPPEIQKLVEEREQARKEKDFARSDEFRSRIESAGFIIEDTPAGYKLSVK